MRQYHSEKSSEPRSEQEREQVQCGGKPEQSNRHDKTDRKRVDDDHAVIIKSNAEARGQRVTQRPAKHRKDACTLQSVPSYIPGLVSQFGGYFGVFGSVLGVRPRVCGGRVCVTSCKCHATQTDSDIK